MEKIGSIKSTSITAGRPSTRTKSRRVEQIEWQPRQHLLCLAQVIPLWIGDLDTPVVHFLHSVIVWSGLLQQCVAQLPVEIHKRPLPLAGDRFDKRLHQVRSARMTHPQPLERFYERLQRHTLYMSRAQPNRRFQDGYVLSPFQKQVGQLPGDEVRQLPTA